MKKVAVVLRCWNNPLIVERTQYYLRVGVGLVVVVVNAAPDAGKTREWLKGIADPRLKIIEMFEGYSWSNALNRAIPAIEEERRLADLAFVLNASLEALFTEEDVFAMLDEFKDERVGVVGTSFAGRFEDGVAAELGRSYRLPRNTGMMIRFSSFEMQKFDTRYDTIGGMEDADFLIALRVLSDQHYVMLNRNVPLVVGINYNQAEKEKKELVALHTIAANWRERCARNTPQRERLEDVLRSMELS